MKSYTIHWKSIDNGRIGAGTFLFEREEAERLAAELNENYPGIQHQVVLAASAPMESAAGQSNPPEARF